MADRIRRWLASLDDPAGELRSILRRVGKNVSVGVGGYAATGVLGIARTALLTKTISVAGYGEVLIVLELTRFLSAFADVGIHDLIFRFYSRFRAREDADATSALLQIAAVLSVTQGIVLTAALYLGAPVLAEWIYGDPRLAPLFRTYAVAALFLSMTGFYTSILRVHDRFSVLAGARVLGSAAMLAYLVVYLLVLDGRDLSTVMNAFVLGIAIHCGIPTFLAYKEVHEHRRPSAGNSGLSALRPYGRELRSTLLQANLRGYLKLGSRQGGAVLLGILSTPTQVAWYGVAQQLVRPLGVLQDNVQDAIMPELLRLEARGEHRRLHRLTRLLTGSTLIVGGGIAAVGLLAASPILEIVTRSEYLASIPTFRLMILASYLSLAFLAFYPLALACGALRRRNVMAALRLLYLGIAAGFGLTAFRLAVVELAGAATTRLGSDLQIFRTIRERAASERDGERKE